MAENESKHHLILLSTHDSGFEEWHCPTCGRRLLMRWSPAYERVVLEAGDELAGHTAWKGPNTTESAPRATPKPAPDAPSLAPWQAWMDKVNFDGLWE